MSKEVIDNNEPMETVGGPEKSTDEKHRGNAIETWEEFHRELKMQFYPQYAKKEAWAKLCCLT
ncbi:hypothetical protein PVK06_026882 [Gossypium arboreum]|uniref:Uncharacterized protein n=1 Tax=Gossypium arboreum TaxID=29729 RepID=A0ABR0P2B5_GOSAR|nr:hypothetical protein PVK06_026882 [Gossypium arboreum]